MRDIRLLFAGLPTLLSAIIRQAAGLDPAVRIVGELKTLEGLEVTVAETRPDVLVVGLDGGDSDLPRECVASMYGPTQPRTLTISSDGKLASAWRLRPDAVRIEDASPTEILAVLRELSEPPPEVQD